MIIFFISFYLFIFLIKFLWSITYYEIKDINQINSHSSGQKKKNLIPIQFISMSTVLIINYSSISLHVVKHAIWKISFQDKLNS